MDRSLLSRVSLAIALCVAVGLIAGCPASEATSGRGDGIFEGEDENPANDLSAVLVASDNCDPADVLTQNNGACATCLSTAGEELRICGNTDSAVCESREGPFGDVCQTCVSELGVTLYDDCVSEMFADEANCEGRASDPGSGDDLAPDGDVVCSTCFDAAGNIASTTCEPSSDECQERTLNDGRVCRECTRDGVVVVLDCGSVDLDPSTCEAYENTIGRCIDCYEDDILVLHQCQVFEETIASCVSFVDPSESLCEICHDQHGTELSRQCASAGVPSQSQCVLLEYTNQTCVVCVDVNGNVVSNRCQAVCEPGDECPEPPPCEFATVMEDGALCRSCAVDESLTEFETQCASSDIYCTQEDIGSLPPDGGEDEPTLSTCTQCFDGATGLEVFRDCAGGGAPICSDIVNADGSICNVCYDSYSNDVLYTNCATETCFLSAEREELKSEAGVTVVTEEGVSEASCVSCAQPGGEVLSSCGLESACSPAEGLVDPDPECSGLAGLLVQPLACVNPWGEVAPGEDELLRILSWAAEAPDFDVVRADVLATQVATPCDLACVDCIRGDTLAVAFDGAEAVAARAALADVLVTCELDSDCPQAALCIDSVCGY